MYRWMTVVARKLQDVLEDFIEGTTAQGLLGYAIMHRRLS